MGAFLTKSKVATVANRKPAFAFNQKHVKIRNGWIAVVGIGLIVYVSVFDYINKKKRERMNERRRQGLPVKKATESIVIDTDEYKKLKMQDEQKQRDALSL